MLSSVFSFLHHVPIRSTFKRSIVVTSSKWANQVSTQQTTRSLNMVATTPKITENGTPTTDISQINIAEYELPTNNNSPNLLRMRHSTAHVMAMAVQKLFPQTRTATGPWTDNG